MKELIFLFCKRAFLLLLFTGSIPLFAQQPIGQVMLKNDTLLNPHTYKFDVWVRCKGGNGVNTINLKGFQGGFKQNFANYKGNGNLTVSIDQGSSQFGTNPFQTPTIVMFKPFSSIPTNIQINPNNLATPGMTISDSATSPTNAGWVRACTLTLSDTVDFLTGSPDIFFNVGGVYSTVVMANYNNPNPTDGTIPFDTINRLVNPVFNGPITHYNVTGSGSYLTGTNGLTIGLSGSEPKCAYKLQLNGTTIDSTEIKGTGGPINWYHKTAGTYTVLARKMATYEIDTLMNGSAIVTTSNTITGPADSIHGTINICIGQNNVTYYIHKITNATTYNWNYSGTGVTLANINDTTITLSFPANATSGVLSVYGQNIVGSGTPYYLNINVSSVPAAAGTISGTTSVCPGQNVTLTVPPISNATNYVWTLPAGCTGTSGTNNSIIVGIGTNAVSGTISVYGNSYCGVGSSSSISITVNPLPGPAGTITGPTSVCYGQNNAVYTVPTISNTIYYFWNIPYTATGSSLTNSISLNFDPNYQPGGGISVRGYNGCGYGASSTLSIVSNGNPIPLTPGVISGLTTVCQGQTNVTYTVPTAPYATSYTWTLPFGTYGTSTTNSIVVIYDTNAVSGNISVSGSNTCGNGPPSNLGIVINPLPSTPGSITGQSTVCAGQNNVMYTLPPITNASSYTWTFPNGVNGYSTTNIISLNYNSNASSGNISVKGENSCGFGTASIFPVTVTSLPATPGNISGASNVCFGQNNVNYSIPSLPNATSYIWTYPSGITGTSNTNNIYLNFGTSAISGNITVKGQNICGTGPTKTLPISLNSLPGSAGAISGLSQVCNGQNNVLYTTPLITGASTYYWNLPMGAVGSSTTNSITLNYSGFAQNGTIKVSGHNICGNGTVSTHPVSVINCNSGNVGTSTTDGNIFTYPNPFNISTTISYTLRESNLVEISILDILGKEVEQLINTNQSEGTHQVKFNAGDLPSGIYFYKIKVGSTLFTGKLILTK